MRELDLRSLLLRFDLLRFDVAADFDGAVNVYRRCRAAGVAPRGMIAAVAWRRGAAILAHDIDLARVARVIEIPLDPASRGATAPP